MQAGYTVAFYTLAEIKQEERGRVINNNSWVQQAATCFQPGEVRGPIQATRLAQRSISFKYGRQQILTCSTGPVIIVLSFPFHA